MNAAADIATKTAEPTIQVLPGDAGMSACLAVPAGTGLPTLASDAQLLVTAAIAIIDVVGDVEEPGGTAGDAIWGAKVLLKQAATLMAAVCEGVAA